VVDLQVDRLGQAVVQQLDVAARGGALAGRDVDAGAEDAPALAVVRAYGIDGDADAPLRLVAAIGVGRSAPHEGLDARAVELAPHHTHALAAAPVEVAVALVQLELLRRVDVAFGKAYPDISVRLQLTDRRVNLLEEHVDLAVRIGQLPDSSLIPLRVGLVRPVLCVERRMSNLHPGEEASAACSNSNAPPCRASCDRLLG